MNWLREIFSGTNQRLSSKRVLGSFCIILSTLVICYLGITQPELPTTSPLLEFVLITGGALLGVGVAERKWNNKIEEK